MADKYLAALPGSMRHAVPGATLVGATDPDKTIRVSIFSRRSPNPPPAVLAKAQAIDRQPITKRVYLSDQEFTQVYGATKADLAAIAAFAKSENLKVVDSSPVKRRVLVEGKISDIEKAFGVKLKDYKHERLGKYRGREGKIYIPSSLLAVIKGVEGLDTRPSARPRLVRTTFEGAPIRAGEAHGAFNNPWPGTFLPPEVAGLYSYPSNTDGAGQNIAIFAFNGGDDPDPRGGYNAAALQTYFMQTIGQAAPNIQDVVVQGPGNDPGPDSPQSREGGDATGEVMLDLCVAGSIAPRANIFVYFTEFTNQGWIEALQAAITDGNGISVISISYGNPEDDPHGRWTRAGVKLVDDALEAAKSKGVTICVAAGDDGSSDEEPFTSKAHADFPSSSRWVLGVGGTKLTATSTAPAQIAQEVVWNELDLPRPAGAGGGGISAIFPLPSYQSNADVPRSANPPHRIGRGIPDVAAVGDPYTGVVIMHVSGAHLEPIGGTSASAPIWATLIARLNQSLGVRLGFLNPTLYASCAVGVLNDITAGNNGSYAAGPGWDACTGLGTPNGDRLLHALKNAPAPPP